MCVAECVFVRREGVLVLLSVSVSECVRVRALATIREKYEYG